MRQGALQVARVPLRVLKLALPFLLVGVLAGCGGAEQAGLGPDPNRPGSLTVTVQGLPAGGQGSVTVSGAGGFSRTIEASETLTGLPPGTYSISATDQTIEGDGYRAAPVSQSIAVRSGAVASATVEYSPTTGRIQLTVVGVPDGAADIVVTGAEGFTRTVSGPTQLRTLPPGTYTVRARPVQVEDEGFASPVDSQLVLVTPGPVAAPIAVEYGLATGRLAVTVLDVPDGTLPSIRIEGPDGFLRSVSASGVVKGLPPGRYRIVAPEVTLNGDRYAGVAAPDQVDVAAGAAPVAAEVRFRLASGALRIQIAGLPTGIDGSVNVTGPVGFQQTVTSTETLRGLAPGSYTVAATNVTTGGSLYVAAPAQQLVTVSAVADPVVRQVSYSPGVGTLDLTISGLSGGIPASVTVGGPGGYVRTVTGSTSLADLAPGTYTITAGAVSSGGQVYQPTPGSQAAVISVGGTVARLVSYAPTLGSLTITVSGLPGGAAAAVQVSGPAGFSRAVQATTTLTGLAAGTYIISAATVSSGGQNYLASPASQSRAVVAGATATVSVAYATVALGSLSVSVSGLPGGTLASVQVTGPGGYSQAVTGTQQLNGLTPGSYTVAAAAVVSGVTTYTPTPLAQNVTVPSGATGSATVTYSTSAPGATLNLTIDGMYLTQPIARYDGTTPVVAGRDAYLRVFVRANQANTAAPAVRVRFYHGASLVQTSTITAPGASTPLSVNEGTLASSWNLAVSGTLVQSNLRILADVDPTNAVAESSDGDNQFPTSGTPANVDVRTVPTWQVRFVPVLQQVNGLQGNVTAGNMAQHLDQSLKMLPIAAYNADVRAAYTTTAPVLQSNNGNSAWGTILLEVRNLRTADASTRYYYGVVKTTYGSGIAGMGYVGGGWLASIGWDHLPSASGVMAHELGHNMGRSHAPCGGVSGADAGYPHAGGAIGSWGIDLATMGLKSPTGHFDLMGYCSPDWISDYTWRAMIAYRQSNPNYAPPVAVSASTVGALVVWGRITAAGVQLEPALRVATPTPLAATNSPYRAEGYAADGRLLFSYPIAVHETHNDREREEHFSSAIPLDATSDRDLVRLRFVGPAGSAERRSIQGLAAAGTGKLQLRSPAVSLRAPNAVQAGLTWDAATYPIAMVRDAATGEILSFARGGSAAIWTSSRRFEVTFSDGVRSVVQRVE
ncbi:MAG: hypothetical protein ACYC2K_11250 [Gemmatimonadales bacterium]